MPNKDVYSAIQKIFPLPVCPWDDYFIAMAQTDYFAGNAGLQAAKSFFIRKAPFKGSYALLGGLTEFIRILNEHRFGDECLSILKDQGYSRQFLEYLRYLGSVAVNLKVYAPREGSMFLPMEPVVTVEGDIIAVRIAEGMMACLNPSSLFLTKWNRVAQVAEPGLVMEFSRRRAQSPERASLYAHLGGAAISSNTEMRKALDIPIRGTMGHEFVQSWGDEFLAFDKWLYHNPNKPVLLVDTINTMASGIPNAVKAYKLHKAKIDAAGGTFGVRFDSGDLAYLAMETAKVFQNEGIFDYRLFMTNDLDEYKIESIKQQIFTNAGRLGLSPIQVLDKLVWAAGTLPGTCEDQPSLGGVAKLVEIDHRAVIKIAKDNPIKTSIPGNNRSTYVYRDGWLECCVIHHKDERVEDLDNVYHPDDFSKSVGLSNKDNLTYVKRQELIDLDRYRPSVEDVRKATDSDFKGLHWTHKRLENPHTVKVSLSPKVFHLRKEMIRDFKLIQD